MADPVGKTILQLAVLNGQINRDASWIEVHVEGQQSSKRLSLTSVLLRGLSAKEVVQLTHPEVVSDADFAEFIKGADGKDVYDVAVEEGFEGTRSEFLASLTGEDGASAFDIAKAAGYPGTESQWAAGLNSAVTNIAELLSDVETLQTGLSGHGTRLSAAEQAVTAHGQALTTHGQTLQAHTGAIEGHTTTLGQQATTIADHTQALGQQGQALNDLDEAQAGLASEVQGLQAKTAHVREEKNPDVIPTFVGQQWLNTLTGASWEAKGLLIGDWVQDAKLNAAGVLPASTVPTDLTLTTVNQKWPHPSVNLKVRLTAGTGVTKGAIRDDKDRDVVTFELDTVSTSWTSSGLLTGLSGQLRYAISEGNGTIEAVASINVD